MPSGTGRRSSRADAKKGLAAPKQSIAFAPLPGAARTAQIRILRVCVVTSEILGPVKNGGIGTATSALIDQLQRDGHEVTILYTLVQHGQPECAERDWAHWVERHAVRGITLISIQHPSTYNDWMRKSWLVKQHLGANEYDVVYFNEHHGSAYYSLCAKRAGLPPFSEQVHCVITHGAIEWVLNVNDQRVSKAADLQMIGLERRSVEWADVVIGPSQYLLQEYRRYGWALPQRTYRQPYPIPINAARPRRTGLPVEELVFFGRLETRKGLWLFCEALDRVGEALRGRKVTFLGRPNDAGGVASPVFVLARAEKWPCPVNMLLDYSQEQALAYLAEPGRLAVMPSLADNSPCVVYECMQQQIPFLTTSGSGAEELIHGDCQAANLCEPTAAALAAKLVMTFDQGAATASPAFPAEENLARLSSWHALLADPRAQREILGTGGVQANPTAPARQPATVLFIDDREMGLGTLLDRLQRHMAEFGDRAGFALASDRGDPLYELVSSALQARADEMDCSFEMVAPAGLDAFLKRQAKAGASLFVTDVRNDLVEAFVELAADMLARRAAVAVTCAAASRPTEDDRPVITELPAGDLPAAGGLNMPITSSAWAVAEGRLTANDFKDPVTGRLLPAQDVGQSLFHRLITAGDRVRLIPEAGTIRTANATRPGHGRHWYRSATLAAETLGLKPSLFPNAAPWLAASSLSFRGDTVPERPAGAALLPPAHPLHGAVHTGTDVADLARFAAALGRPDQAVQIATASEMSASVSDLLATAVRAVRNRPPVDLRALLAGHLRPEDAPEALKLLRASAANLAMSQRPGWLVLNLADPDLTAGTVTFFDVALSGHEAYSLKLTSAGTGACNISTTIIDQSSGAKLGSATMDVQAGEERSLAIPLNGIHGLFCLILEVSAAVRSSPALWVSEMVIS